MNKPPQFVFIGRDDLTNVQTWSGIPFHINKAFEAYSTAPFFIDELGYPNTPSIKVKNQIRGWFNTKNYYSFETAKFYADQINKKLDQLHLNYDFLFFIDFIEAIPFIKTKKPIIQYTDASKAHLKLLNYKTYQFTNKELQQVLELEQASFNNSDLVILTSNMAKNFIHKQYNLPNNKLSVLPFACHIFPEPIDYSVNGPWKQSSEHCNFLFIANEWKRKGGDQAIELIKSLNENNFPAKLTICGAYPNDSSKLEENYFDFYPFLHKDVEIEHQQIEKLMSNAHFLLLPTHADVTPLVLSEAFAFGLPIISSKVGAIDEIVGDSQGILFNPNFNIQQITHDIIKLFNSNKQYQQMRIACRKEFINKYHFKDWVRQLTEKCARTKKGI